jgi:hypothetical protein
MTTIRHNDLRSACRWGRPPQCGQAFQVPPSHCLEDEALPSSILTADCARQRCPAAQLPPRRTGAVGGPGRSRSCDHSNWPTGCHEGPGTRDVARRRFWAQSVSSLLAADCCRAPARWTKVQPARPTGVLTGFADLQMRSAGPGNWHRFANSQVQVRLGAACRRAAIATPTLWQWNPQTRPRLDGVDLCHPVATRYSFTATEPHFRASVPSR